MDNLITLFTDAGMRPDGFAAWAAWAKRDGETIRRSGIVKRRCASSNEAEMCAAANGLAVVHLLWNPAPQTRILLQVDSTTAIDAIGGYVDQFRDIVGYINKLIAEKQWYLTLRHVKGHRGTISPRHAVNTWCDRECTRLLRTHQRTNMPDDPIDISQMTSPIVISENIHVDMPNVVAFTHGGMAAINRPKLRVVK